MASLIESIRYYNEKMEQYADPRVKSWPLMRSPLNMLLLLFAYNVTVLSIGPRLMAKRKALELKPLIALYNLTQILVNAFFVYESCRLLWFSGENIRFTCMEVDYSDTPLGRQKAAAVWLFFMSRILDLIDTLFFVARKKQNQVTFLHVYHHTAVVFFTWLGVKYVAGGHGVFFGTINSFVHVVMYSYYMLTLINAEYKKAWWKKYLTQMQMMQFIAVGVHAILALCTPNCSYPKGLIILALPQDVFMFILFADFYRKTYMKPKAKDTQQKNDSIPIKIKSS